MNLLNHPTTSNPHCLVNSNRVAHHLRITAEVPCLAKLSIMKYLQLKLGNVKPMHPFSNEKYRKYITGIKNEKLLSYRMYKCVASLQNSPLVGRNESGIIHDLSKKPFFLLFFSLFCLLISILRNIVLFSKYLRQ